MRCKLVKLNKFSGNIASIYSIIIGNEQEMLFDKFIKENINSFTSETKDILMRLITIGQKTGARIDFFKEFEGRPGDGVCALYDQPGSKLRLYCIKYGSQLIVVGSGGKKSKSIRAFQEDDKLEDENYFLRWLSNEITKRILDGEIEYTNNYLDFSGNLIFEDYTKED